MALPARIGADTAVSRGTFGKTGHNRDFIL
jgi:hypothetical protein